MSAALLSDEAEVEALVAELRRVSAHARNIAREAAHAARVILRYERSRRKTPGPRCCPCGNVLHGDQLFCSVPCFRRGRVE